MSVTHGHETPSTRPSTKESTVPLTTALSSQSAPPLPLTLRPLEERTILRIVPWPDPIADPHGVHPCSRYVELYWLGVIGPSTTWLLRRVSYGFEVHQDGFDLNLPETARSLGLGQRMGKNSPFRRALQRLCTFELARPYGPGGLAVRTRIPPLPLRHLSRLPAPLQASHRRWLNEQQLSGPQQMRLRAHRLAAGLAVAGRDQTDIELQLGKWHFHPAVAFRAAEDAVRLKAPVENGSHHWASGAAGVDANRPEGK
jgi:hypothetical protein